MAAKKAKTKTLTSKVEAKLYDDFHEHASKTDISAAKMQKILVEDELKKKKLYKKYGGK